MLRSIKALRGYTIAARDGEIGHVHEFYFDDASWILRYLVVDTGPWLFGRKVLISPVALAQPEWGLERFPVLLTKEQVENSPSIDLDAPVSRQQELELHRYYGWPVYWSGPGAPVGPGAVAIDPIEAAPGAPATQQEEGDPHLRSTREVIGYHIEARDGEFGEVEDFIVDDVAWIIRYMVIDTRAWLPGRKVLISPRWIEEVDWIETKVSVDLPQETIKNSPEYNPKAPVNREYEERLYDYYGRPAYW